MSELDELDSAVIHRMEIQRSLGRVEGKLDQIMFGIASHELRDTERFTEVNRSIDLLDKRHRSLERKVWYATGTASVFIFFLSHYAPLLFK